MDTCNEHNEEKLVIKVKKGKERESCGEDYNSVGKTREGEGQRNYKRGTNSLFFYFSIQS